MGIYAFVTGYLTRDPETRVVAGDKEVTGFVLGVSPGVAKDKAEDYDTVFVRFDLWSPGNAYLAKYAKKGDLIGVQGELAERKYTDRDGNARTQTEILRPQNGSILSRKADRESGAANRGNSGGGERYSSSAPARSYPSASASSREYDDDLSDEIPF